MLYRILKFLSKLTLWGYFRRTTVMGKENIPKDGPYLFVANHPSAFMDPIVIATSVQPSIYFIAAGEYVGKGIKGWFFKRMLHMIPVYRPSTRPEDTHKNKEMFSQCYSHLSGKGALLIFPEGVSLTERKLKPLKTGAARIAIGAEKLNNFELDIAIVPIGLNYSNPHQFRSDLFVNIGKPIYVSDFKDNDSENEIELAKRITLEVQQKMERTILHLETDDADSMLEKLNLIYGRELKKSRSIGFEGQEKEFLMHQDFVKAIDFFQINSPKDYAIIEQEIDEYLSTLNENELSDKNIAEYNGSKQFRRYFSFIIGFPYFLLGLLNNFIPYKLVGMITNRIKIDQTFTGSISLAIGLFVFLIWYCTLPIFIGNWIGWPAVFYPILMYVTGLYSLLYFTAIKYSKQRNHFRKALKKDTPLIKSLTSKRTSIVAKIQLFQRDYTNRKEQI